MTQVTGSRCRSIVMARSLPSFIADRRLPPSWKALAAGSLITIPALIVLDGGVAAWAQFTVRQVWVAQQVSSAGQYSVVKHCLAMLALSLLAGGMACMLSRSGQPVLAGLVLAGVCAGPMTVLAAPVRAGLLTADLQDTTWWWHGAVQGVQFLLLAGWTWWTTRCLPERRSFMAATADPELSDQHHGRVAPGLLFALFTAVTMTAQILARTDNGIESPGLLVIFGWAALGAAGSVIVIQSSWRPMCVTVLVATVLALGMLYDAYYRPGAWPGVAGWDDATSPIILSFSATVCVLAGPLLGTALRRRHPPSGADSEPTGPRPALKSV